MMNLKRGKNYKSAKLIVKIKGAKKPTERHI